MADEAESWAVFDGGTYGPFVSYITIGSADHAGHLAIDASRGVGTHVSTSGDTTLANGTLSIKDGEGATCDFTSGGKFQVATLENGSFTVEMDGGTLNMTGGTTNGRFLQGTGKNSNSAVYLRGGTLTTTSYFCVGANAGSTSGSHYFELDGGTVNQTANNDVRIGDNGGSGTENVLCVKSGTFNARTDIRVGSSAPAEMTVQGGTVNASNGSIQIAMATDAGKPGVVTLSGGETIAQSVAAGTANDATLTFDGGRLTAAADNTAFIAANEHLSVFVTANGGVVDTVGHAITIAEDIENAPGETGTLTFTGGGVVTLTGAMNYTGATTIGAATTLSLIDSGRTFTGPVAFADTSRIRVSRAAPAAVTAPSITISASGSVIVDFDASELAPGAYPILTQTDAAATFAAEVAARFTAGENAPSVSFAVSADGKSIVLTIADIKPGVWTGLGDGVKFSDARNWIGNLLPTEADDVVISVSETTTLDCDVAFSVKSITFAEGSAQVTLSGTGCITNATKMVNASAVRPVINVPVEFVADDSYKPIDVMGEVDFQIGVTGTVPASHTTFYGNYTLTATSWTLSSVITLAEGAKVKAEGMTINISTANSKFICAEPGSSLELVGIKTTMTGDVFGSYKGVLHVGSITIDTGQSSTSSFQFGTGFTGVLKIGHFLVYPGTGTVWAFPYATVVMGGTGFHLRRGSLPLGGISSGQTVDEYVIHSSADWTMKVENANDYNFAISLSAPHIVVDTSDYGGDADGHTVTIKHESKAKAAARLLEGPGALAASGNGALVFQNTCYFTGGLTASNSVTVGVNAGVSPGNGNVTLKDTSILDLRGSPSGTAAVNGTLTMTGGTTLRIPTLASGVLPLSVNALAFDGVTAQSKVKLDINGETLDAGRYPLITSADALPANTVESFEFDLDEAVKLPADAETSWEVSGNTLYLVVKCANDFIWTGAGSDAKFSNGANWQGGSRPESGANVIIALGTEGTIECDIADFAPASITFPAGSAAVTIAGENAITGVAAVTNLSDSSHTINVPVYFTGNIQVKQAAMAETGDLTKAHVTFVGGAYAADGCALESGNSAAVYSRCIFGRYCLSSTESNPWTAVNQGGSKRVCLAGNSSLYIPYAGALTELYIGNNARVDIGKMALSATGRVSYRNYGEVTVTNLVLTGTGDRYLTYGQGTSTPGVFKFNSVTNGMSNNWFYFSDANVASSHTIFVGEGGLNFGDTGIAYALNQDKADSSTTIRPWYSNFTISDGGTIGLGIRRNAVFNTSDKNNSARTITIDATTQVLDSNVEITVSGSGVLRVNKPCDNSTQPTVNVTESATLAFASGASLGTGATTIAAGAALEVAQSGTVALGGGLTLDNGAVLAFNYTGRAEPVLALEGKTVTFKEGEPTNVTVRISADAGARAHGGKNVLTTGGKFADATVTLAEGAPSWASGVTVENGEIVLSVKPAGLAIFVR